jgi:RNA polymerase sigma-70 factor, ECF subfamily
MSFALDIKGAAEIEIGKATIAPIDPEPPSWNDIAATDTRTTGVSEIRDEDAELLDRLAAGDELAFRMLVERHIDRAYAIALRIVGNAADAEDVVQDTMLKVWTHRGRWQHGRAKFSTWLYRVVSNRCIDLRRKPRTENVDVVPEVADARPDASSVIERNELRDMLETAMRRLPEQQRIAVILSYHENMSNGEIAEVMDTTVAAVESLRRHERDIRHAFTDL